MQIQNKNPYIICIQESHIKPPQIPKIKNFTSYHKEPNLSPTDRARGGVITFVNNDYSSSEILINSPLQVIATQINYPINMTVSNIYLPPNQKFSENDINNIVEQLPSPFLIVGDFNSHNSIWGSLKTDKKGRIIERIADDWMLTIMNLEKRKPTHINHQNGNNSSIDLSICSPIIDGYFEWDTADNIYRSDHFPIVISTLNNTFTTHQRPRRKLNKADWENYENELNINEKLICNDVNKTVYNITQQILTAANNNIPKSSSKINGHRSVPWWNEEVNKAVKLRKKILRFFNRKIK